MYNYLLKYLENLQSKGRYSFTLKELRNTFRKNYKSLSMSLTRLSKKGKIVSVKKGFYVIVPAEYSGTKMLPPYLFINDMMEDAGREYYLGLLTAAVFHGAGHQKPQEIFVITTKPSIRKISVQNLIINFICRRKIVENGLEQRKTDTGYVKISGPELTALDLIQLNKSVGGLSRVVEVINELKDKIDMKLLLKLTREGIPIPVFQRFGYMIETVFRKKTQSDVLYKKIKKIIFRPIAMNPLKETEGYKSANRWRIIENEDLELEK